MILAVYGSLKKGFHNHHFLENSEFLGTHLTKPIYTMYNLGSFPAITLHGNTSIYCEVYSINDNQTVNRINRLEGFNGIKNDPNNLYDRHTIITEYGETEIYIFTRKLNTLIIKSGLWTL